MTILFLAIVGLSTIVAIFRLIVPFVCSPGMMGALGPLRAGLLGMAILGTIAVAGFAIADLDHIPLGNDPRPLFWDSVQLAGVSTIFWLPIYLFSFSRSRKQVIRNLAVSGGNSARLSPKADRQ